MDIELNSQLAQVQKTVITQKLIEQLEILQMPSFDLSQHIEEMVNANPLLECYTPENDSDFEKMLEGCRNFHSERKESEDQSEVHDSDEFLAYAKADMTLREYLQHQLLELKLHPKNRMITQYLIESLDSDGYLKEDRGELAKTLGVPAEGIERCIKILQALEPSGVGARDLKECLLLQLKRKKLLNNNIVVIISNYFDLLASKSFLKISKETGISKVEVEGVYSIIKTLNPKPGCNFENREMEQYVVPDLFLTEVNGRYIAEFNNESTPAVRINNYYVNLMKNPESSQTVRDYIKKNLTGALALIKVLEQRKKTILDITNYIVNLQADYFKNGAEDLKPLTMQTIADSLGIHVSTVSRAVNGKYIETSRGVYELRHFFSSKLETECENSTSAASVKNMIKKIVLEEDKIKPFSDEQIKSKLESMGIKAARRTIAKYRDELSILPASMRKS